MAKIYITAIINTKVLLDDYPQGGEVPDHLISMYDTARRTKENGYGTAQLTTKVSPGDHIVNIAMSTEPLDRIQIIDIQSEATKKGGLFSKNGGKKPNLQDDGTWLSKVSPISSAGAADKYTVRFTINGSEIEYFWDPKYEDDEEGGI
ncbi:hypothetical protein [Sediminitomix flava]|uniref:Inclusion body protein n=1 Tax=Sediminitomix flava TaxID=379075 RepID=A0A315ZH39_SEDFL|nr:hypothetical protein [Sediminitomix flava]PWJ44034.1 hypothetical protein BC781_101384 [Sediminitomix flava]